MLRRLDSLCAGLLDGVQQRIEIVRTVMAKAIDKERRRAIDAAACAAEHVFAYALGVGAAREFVEEGLEVEVKLLRVTGQVVGFEGFLVLEQEVVHVPELPLRAGGLGSFRGLLRM